MIQTKKVFMFLYNIIPTHTAKDWETNKYFLRSGAQGNLNNLNIFDSRNK